MAEILTHAEMKHIEYLQELLLAYAVRNHLGSIAIKNILTTLTCTVAIRNGQSMMDLLMQIQQEYSECEQSWLAMKHPQS